MQGITGGMIDFGNFSRDLGLDLGFGEEME